MSKRDGTGVDSAVQRVERKNILGWFRRKEQKAVVGTNRRSRVERKVAKAPGRLTRLRRHFHLHNPEVEVAELKRASTPFVIPLSIVVFLLYIIYGWPFMHDVFGLPAEVHAIIASPLLLWAFYYWLATLTLLLRIYAIFGLIAILYILFLVLS